MQSNHRREAMSSSVMHRGHWGLCLVTALTESWKNDYYHASYLDHEQESCFYYTVWQCQRRNTGQPEHVLWDCISFGQLCLINCQLSAHVRARWAYKSKTAVVLFRGMFGTRHCQLHYVISLARLYLSEENKSRETRCFMYNTVATPALKPMTSVSMTISDRQQWPHLD